jgi:hypothetical protein
VLAVLATTGVALVVLAHVMLGVLWLPLVGLVLWRADGAPIVATIAWVTPILACLAGALVLPDPARTAVLAVLILLCLAMSFSGSMRRRWLRQVVDTGARRGVPEHAEAIQRALRPVDAALRVSLGDRMPDRVRDAVSRAQSELAAIEIPESDPWTAVKELAVLWLADLGDLSTDPDKDASAYARANQRGRELHRAEAALLRDTPQ